MIDDNTPSRTNYDIMCNRYKIQFKYFHFSIFSFEMYFSFKNKSYLFLINTKSHAYSIGQKYNIYNGRMSDTKNLRKHLDMSEPPSANFLSWRYVFGVILFLVGQEQEGMFMLWLLLIAFRFYERTITEIASIYYLVSPSMFYCKKTQHT